MPQRDAWVTPKAASAAAGGFAEVLVVYLCPAVDLASLHMQTALGDRNFGCDAGPVCVRTSAHDCTTEHRKENNCSKGLAERGLQSGAWMTECWLSR